MHLRLSVLFLLVWIVVVLLQKRAGPTWPRGYCISLTCVSFGLTLEAYCPTLRRGLNYGCLNFNLVAEIESNLVDTLGAIVQGGKERFPVAAVSRGMNSSYGPMPMVTTSRILRRAASNPASAGFFQRQHICADVRVEVSSEQHSFVDVRRSACFYSA